MSELIKTRYDFVLLFDVTDGNPNGDPDAGNLPRVDAETGMGLVTDVCLKRKVRNYVQIVKNAKRPYDIFIKEKAVLNRLIDESHEQEEVKIKDKTGDKTEAARKWMCANYYDIRTFGAVLSVGKNAGQVRGPVQLTFGRSIEPVVALEHSITRMAVTTEAEAEKQGGDNRTMGRKFTIPYGLYLTHGFISAHLAEQTGFNEEDLQLLWDAFKTMFDHDHSAARGMMSTRKLLVFKHSTALGNAPAYQLFDLINVQCKDKSKPARVFSDYSITSKEEIEKKLKLISKEVELIEML
jgi:CRISPR-associated protein Csd2